MKRILILAAAAAFTLTLAQAVPAQDAASQIVGVWKLASFDVVETESQKKYQPDGAAPRAQYIFTKGGHFALIITSEKRAAPAAAEPTDAEDSRSQYTSGAACAAPIPEPRSCCGRIQKER